MPKEIILAFGRLQIRMHRHPADRRRGHHHVLVEGVRAVDRGHRGRKGPDVGQGLRAVHRAFGGIPQQTHRRGQRAEKEVREANGEILRQSRKILGVVHQKTGAILTRGEWVKVHAYVRSG